MNPENADARVVAPGAAVSALGKELAAKDSAVIGNGQADFDYGQLDGESWQFVQNARDQIKGLGK